MGKTHRYNNREKLDKIGKSKRKRYNDMGDDELEYERESNFRNEKTISIVLKEIEKIWNKNPDLRFGQLIDNGLENAENLYYVEDASLVEYLKEFYDNMEGECQDK